MMNELADRLSMAPNPIFDTINGEGAMLGVPMTFVRLAGCSVGCPLCDTDYSFRSRMTVTEIIHAVSDIGNEWVWITGGEPTDQDLVWELIRSLRESKSKVALATSGIRQVKSAVDWLSVSPHTRRFKQKSGDEIKLCPNLSGLALCDFDLRGTEFTHYFVQPCDGGMSQDELEQCIDFVKTHRKFRLGVQAHKQWGLA